MSEEKVWKTWKARWKITNQNAIDVVKEIFRMGGTRPVHKDNATLVPYSQDGLDFAIELGWLKECPNGRYKVTACGLMILSHRFKD